MGSRIRHANQFMKYNSKARIVLDIAIQVLFYAALLGGFWLLSFFIP